MNSPILVPLDGSPLAEQALSCAVTLAQGLETELVLLRAISIPLDASRHPGVNAMKGGNLQDLLQEEADKYLGEVADRVRLAGLGVQSVVRHGPAADVIVDYAEQMGIRQIVMATHGYSGIKRWTHGSVAERVLQAASVPVLMVRGQEKEAEVSQKLTLCRRILVPLDGSVMAEQVLPPVKSVAKAVGAEVSLFQVAVDQPAVMLGSDWFLMPTEGEFEEEEQRAQAYLERVAGPLREEGINVFTSTQIGPVAESIVQFAEDNRIDLIAMCTHGRTGVARWALGSVADRVLRAGGLPILLVRGR